MTDFARLKELVSSALELPDSERDAFLVRECESEALLAEARALISHDEPSASGFAEAIGEKVARSAGEMLEVSGDRQRVARYEILEVLGHGGMGIVYRARQAEDLEREVALKLIRPGFDSEKVTARFESERRALARMEHPNIAGVFDAGTTANRSTSGATNTRPGCRCGWPCSRTSAERSSTHTRRGSSTAISSPRTS